MRRSGKLFGIVAAAGIVVLVLACGVIALVPRRAPVALAAVPPPQVEQRAVQVAETHYNGTITTVTARATTQGEVGALRCSIIGRLQQQVAALMVADRPPPWCDNAVPLWEVTLQGDFHDPDLGNLRTLQVITAPDGNIQVIIAR